MIGIVGTRLAAALTVFLALVFLQAFTGDFFIVGIGAVLNAIPVVCLAALVFFARRSLAQPEIFVLRIRVQDALALFLASLAAAVVADLVLWRALWDLPPDPGLRGATSIGLAFALVMIGAPAVNWLVIWKPWRAQ